MEHLLYKSSKYRKLLTRLLKTLTLINKLSLKIYNSLIMIKRVTKCPGQNIKLYPWCMI